jgi:hypothetical protein
MLPDQTSDMLLFLGSTAVVSFFAYAAMFVVGFEMTAMAFLVAMLIAIAIK